MSIKIRIASSNAKKLAEFEAMGLSVIPGVGVEEIQDKDPYVIAHAKAKEAYIANDSQPTLVEDTSFEVAAWDGLPGPFVKFFLGERKQREAFCKYLPKDNREVTIRTLLAVFDGEKVYIKEGVRKGTIPEKPTGPDSFAFDDIFIPEGETKTYAEMGMSGKNNTSARKKAVDALLADKQLLSLF